MSAIHPIKRPALQLCCDLSRVCHFTHVLSAILSGLLACVGAMRPLLPLPAAHIAMRVARVPHWASAATAHIGMRAALPQHSPLRRSVWLVAYESEPSPFLPASAATGNETLVEAQRRELSHGPDTWTMRAMRALNGRALRRHGA
jgi:hypothetical protein